MLLSAFYWMNLFAYAFLMPMLIYDFLILTGIMEGFYHDLSPGWHRVLMAALLTDGYFRQKRMKAKSAFILSLVLVLVSAAYNTVFVQWL